MYFLKLCLIMMSGSHVIESATVENLNLQRYFPSVTEDQLLSSNKRFQQIMQGATPVDTVWIESKKMGKTDVKLEIDKLNTSYIHQSTWPNLDVKLGSVTAVDFDKDGHVVLFHRANHIWSQDSFDISNVFRGREKGPIQINTVLALDRKTGQLVYEWGKDIFYMPHGLTIDHEDNVWLTDVALHQVFKFGSRGSTDKPLMTLGTAFVPGAGQNKFCKPTSVAVLKNGDFFVADGYCNARILKYSKDGQMILSWGQNSFAGLSYEIAPPNYFAVPHDLTLVPQQNLICTADRENGRIQCFFWSNGTFHCQYHSPLVGDRLFGLDYTPYKGGRLIVVNGPTAELGLHPAHYNEVRGYVWDMTTKKVLGKFGPNDMQFSNPHDVAVTEDGMEVYVAELSPARLHKFLHKSLVKSTSLSALKISNSAPTVAGSIGTALETVTEEIKTLNSSSSGSNAYHGPHASAIIVVSLMLSFTLLMFALALLVARRRKRGCMPFGAKNRRHAWDLPGSKTESFTLGGLLTERNNKRNGFEKLGQNASDEETEETATSSHTKTNQYNGAQFA